MQEKIDLNKEEVDKAYEIVERMSDNQLKLYTQVMIGSMLQDKRLGIKSWEETDKSLKSVWTN